MSILVDFVLTHNIVHIRVLTSYCISHRKEGLRSTKSNITIINMNMKHALLATGALALIGTAQAATIAWSAGTDIASSAAIDHTGAFVLGHNYGATSGGTHTFGDVTFTQTLINASYAGLQETAGIYNGAVDTAFHHVMDSNVYGGGAASIITVSGLTANTSYLIQVLAGDERKATSFARIANGDGTGQMSGNVGTSTSFIGLFTTGAAETTVDLQSFTSPSGDAGISISALQVREVPEPSSAALLGLGGLALILRRRK